jgi:hypothetical protein
MVKIRVQIKKFNFVQCSSHCKNYHMEKGEKEKGGGEIKEEKTNRK